LEAVENYVPEGKAGHPNHIFFLTADASGVLPPISQLTADQATYYFLAGYTSKLAGTEKGLGAEPQSTFSACFGEPFLALHPTRYADLLSERISRHNPHVWLVNTGWTGGPFGVGRRMDLPYTRAMVAAALQGSLDGVPTSPDPIFGLEIPERCPGVPEAMLDPRSTWQDPAAYDRQAMRLANQFKDKIQQFAEHVSPQVLAAGPKG
jgi:phosphoenolpyruvate carboxykinase (ATP)